MSSSWTIINNPVLSNIKGHLEKMHTIKIDLNQSTENRNKKKKTKRILIAKPELCIQILYSNYTKHYGFSLSDVNI